MPGVWRSNAYILASFPIGGLAFTYFVTMLSLGLGLLIIWLGIPVLVATVASAKWFARGERRRAGWLLRQPILSLYLPPHRRGMLGYLHTAIGDSAVWKDLVWLVILLPVFGLCAFTLAVCFWATALGIIFMPVWSWSIPGGVDWGLFTIDTIHEAFAVIPLGVVLFALTIPFTRALAMGMGSFAGSLLAPSERRRVAELERTRAGAVDAQAAELQRIERDLHDGAQARLVALAMDLGMAQEKLASDPEGAQALITGAHTEAKKAIAELRDLSRGIYPAILTDRGLGPALSSIAARNPVEVALDVELDGRLPAATEAAAYFVTVEALTNVAKHSGAASALVSIQRKADMLRVEITDDGDGGADPAGAGLTGLRQRVEALDGRLAVQSGDLGTTIRAELPCASSSPKT
jgi:signal transduction histidine kinase